MTTIETENQVQALRKYTAVGDAYVVMKVSKKVKNTVLYVEEEDGDVMRFKIISSGEGKHFKNGEYVPIKNGTTISAKKWAFQIIDKIPTTEKIQNKEIQEVLEVGVIKHEEVLAIIEGENDE